MAKYDCELLFAIRNSDKFRADAIVTSRSCGVFGCAGNGAPGEERCRKRLAANPAIPQNAFFTPEVINSRHLCISLSVLKGDGGTLWLMECNPPFAVVYFRRACCFLFVPPGQCIKICGMMKGFICNFQLETFSKYSRHRFLLPHQRTT